MKNRLKRLEKTTGVNGSDATYMSHPPENNMYRVQQIYPVPAVKTEQLFTQSEYEDFAEGKDSKHLIEWRWDDEKTVEADRKRLED